MGIKTQLWIVEQTSQRSSKVVFRSEPMGSRDAEEMADYLNRTEEDIDILARIRRA